MKKKIIYSVLAVLLIIFVVSGATYAYFSSVATSNNSNVSATSEKYEIIYHGGTEINGNIKMLADHVGADNTTVEIGLASGVNVDVTATLFINITEISQSLAVPGFKWAVYRISGNNEILENSGNFSGATVNSEVPVLTKKITTTMTSYKIYFWLDGNSVSDVSSEARFRGHVAARSDILTGIVDNS